MKRRSHICAAVTAAGLTAAGAAQAQTFYLLRPSADTRTVIDPADILQAPGSAVRRVATVTVQRSITSESPPQPGYVRSVNEYDCTAKTMRWLSFAAFSRSGAQLATRANPSKAWEAVTPTSGTLAEWRLVCGLSAGDSAVTAASVAEVVVALMASFDATPAPPPAAPSPR